ncbi:hypothetical protein BHF71_08285 [Vulcanibacillus modesticaldus]|uniref:Uncharacterized protein n=1 Tax=Vulcanibacillus modesticaldus TaxID=337097 RepID=A0A1D2YVA8_9BACI|nr:hypothetical protein [Vulcanibacillus modesticaldus]OEF99611.1 hypothetical protein BHF71_08285 [Vulcanibacillus modesticaldus]
MKKTQKSNKYLFRILIILTLLLASQQIIYGIPKQTNNDKIISWLKQIINLDTKVEMKKIKLNKQNSLYVYNLSNDDISGYILTDIDDNLIEANIVEYGFGKLSPYSKNIILDPRFRTIELNSLTYYSPIENFWKVELNNENIYIDASNGDILPKLVTTSLKKILNNHLKNTDSLKASLLNTSLIFDPYDDLFWLLGTTDLQPLSSTDITKLLGQENKILFVGSKYNNLVQFAYPVVGYHLWQNNLYIAIYEESLDSIRFISYNDMINFGNFYLWD